MVVKDAVLRLKDACRLAAVLCCCYQDASSSSLMSMKMVHSFSICFAERSQDSTAAVLSDSSSTQDMFNEPASSQDSLRKTYPEKRISTTCADPLVPGKETLGSAEEKSMCDLMDNGSWYILIKMFLLACRSTERMVINCALWWPFDQLCFCYYLCFLQCFKSPNNLRSCYLKTISNKTCSLFPQV